MSFGMKFHIEFQQNLPQSGKFVRTFAAKAVKFPLRRSGAPQHARARKEVGAVAQWREAFPKGDEATPPLGTPPKNWSLIKIDLLAAISFLPNLFIFYEYGS